MLKNVTVPSSCCVHNRDANVYFFRTSLLTLLAIVPFGDPQQIVQTFVDLVGRHEGSFYNFVHQVHSKGAGLFDGLMQWIELFVNFVRQGLADRVSLEALLPHPDTPERLALITEIDSVIEYHRKLKVAHHERMTLRMARVDLPHENHHRSHSHSQDAAFVQGMMKNLNLSSVVGADVEEAAREDHTDSENSEYDEGLPSMSLEDGENGKPMATGPDGETGKSKFKDRVPIEPPELQLIPNLVPLFTELVKQLLR